MRFTILETSFAALKRNSAREGLIFLLRLMQTGIGIFTEMEVLRKETTGKEGVHCHSVIIKKIDFKSRMQSEEEARH